MANHDILTIGTSAGDLDALRALTGGLPDDLAASVLAVLHLQAQFHSSLDAILSQSAPLPATFTRGPRSIRCFARPGSAAAAAASAWS